MDTSDKYNAVEEQICATTNIPFIQFSQGDTPCLFIHANGYPSACYKPLLEQLQGYDVLAPLSRPCWDDSDPWQNNQWPVLAADLVKFARAHQQSQQFHCVCHSMGAIVLLMAIEQAPELFGKIVFIDPIFLPTPLVKLANWLPNKFTRKTKMITKTLGRPDTWDSLQQAFDFHRNKRAYRALPDPALWQYIVGGTKTAGEQWELKYSKHWEAWFYQHPPYAWPMLRKLDKPFLGLRAEKSEFLTPKSWQKWQKIKPHDTYIEFQGQHHLLPMEAPRDVAHAILDFLE